MEKELKIIRMLEAEIEKMVAKENMWMHELQKIEHLLELEAKILKVMKLKDELKDLIHDKTSGIHLGMGHMEPSYEMPKDAAYTMTKEAVM